MLQLLGPHGDGADIGAAVPDRDPGGPAEVQVAIILRPHTPADLPLLARMNRELAYNEGHRNPMSVAEMEARFKRFVQDEGRTVELFVIADEAIGYATYRREPDPAQPGTDRVFLRQF